MESTPNYSKLSASIDPRLNLPLVIPRPVQRFDHALSYTDALLGGICQFQVPQPNVPFGMA